MVSIYSSNHFKIIQNDNNEHLYCIEFTYPSPILCNSLVKTKLLKGATISDDYKEIIFKAYSVQMYNTIDVQRHHDFAAILAVNLTMQLKYIAHEYGVTFCGYNTENIVVIDGTKSAFLDADLLGDIEEHGTIMISKPFMVSEFFFSPEMKLVKKLPARVHYKTAYFSLGCLLLRALLGQEAFDEFYQEYLSGAEDLVIQKYLDTCVIRETKLYWLICRCLVQEPEKRSILFI
jgi:hypothetical protein